MADSDSDGWGGWRATERRRQERPVVFGADTLCNVSAWETQPKQDAASDGASSPAPASSSAAVHAVGEPVAGIPAARKNGISAHRDAMTMVRQKQEKECQRRAAEKAARAAEVAAAQALLEGAYQISTFLRFRLSCKLQKTG